MQSGFNVESLLETLGTISIYALLKQGMDYFFRFALIFRKYYLDFYAFHRWFCRVLFRRWWNYFLLTGGNQIPDGASIIVTSPMELILLKLRLSAMISFGVVIFVLLIIAARKSNTRWCIDNCNLSMELILLKLRLSGFPLRQTNEISRRH